MSKGFTKDDAVDEPLVVPARAPLPDGVKNYVTPRGLEQLKEELASLTSAKARAERAARAGDDDAARQAAIFATRLGELEIRLAAAQLVDLRRQPVDEVRFGASVTVVREDGRRQCYRIVGVDEANAERGAVAFVSPLARALLGKRVGEVAEWRMPSGKEELEVVAIDYPAASASDAETSRPRK